MAAAAKRFAMNNRENGRNSTGSDTTDTNIRDHCTARFADLIRDANVVAS